MKNTVVILLLFIASTIHAQDCSAYDNLIAEGNTAFSNGNYERAVKKYNLAMLNCPDKIANVQEKILGVFNEIEQLKETANKQKQIALAEKRQAEIARDSTESIFKHLEIEKIMSDSLRESAEAERRKKQRIIDALYFYNDKLSIASRKSGRGRYSKELFGFIDKEGNTVIDFKYETASGFDDTGYARVTKEENNYLIDTSGVEYRIATNIKDLNQDIIALDLRSKQINKLSPKVFDNIQLEILLLSDNLLTTLSHKIKNLINLKTLDLDANVTISPEVEKSLYSKLLNRRVLQIPVRYIKPTGDNINEIDNKLSAIGPKNDWVVHSDRDNNITYTSASSDTKSKSMNFMENFYVIGETDTRVEIVKYDHTIISSNTYRKINIKKAEYYGWADKDKLLLWNNSLVNKETNFTIKALVGCSIIDMLRDTPIERHLTLYNSPAVEANIINNNDVTSFEFLYVFKKENNKYLVGIANKLSRSSTGSQKIIKGWISEKNVQIWSQRLCIEPNDAPEAVAERRAKGIKANIFSNYQGALALKTGTTTQFEKVLWNKDKYEMGYPSSWKRMPVISKLDNKIYKTGVSTDYILKKVPDIDSLALKKIKPISDYKLFVEGYAPIQVDMLEYPLFKHTILMTRQELNELEKNLEKLLDISNTPNQLREEIINTYKIILSSYYGMEAIHEIVNKTSVEVLEIIIELPSSSPLLTKYSITDLQDRRKVSDNEIQEIYYYIDEKLADMKRIIGNPNYFFRSRDETYYWVPQEVLP